MPNNDERKERLSDLGKAAIGVGAAAAFFTRSQIGRELASAGVARTRNALLKSSEQMRGKTLKAMWGRGASDIKNATRAFKEGFDDTNIVKAQIPVRKNNLISGLARRKQMIEQGDKYVTELFNKEFMPNKMRGTIESIIGKGNTEMQRRHKEIADDLMTRHNKSILHKQNGGDFDIPIFTRRFERKLKNYYGDKADQVKAALQHDLANVDHYKENYKNSGEDILRNIQSQFDDYTSYEKKFSQNTFWNNLVGQQSATVKDVLANKKQFENQKIGDASIVNILQELVDKDERFNNLVIDPALKFKDGKFIDYSALGKTYDDIQDSFLSNVGRIIKPLEVRKHIKESPDFFFIPKGMIDEKLQAIIEPGNKELENSYVRMFDKTYRVSGDGTLEHLSKLDNTYLTPSKGFEGQHLRRMSGNVDYNLDDIAELSQDADWLEQTIYDARAKLGLTGKVSKDYKSEIARAAKNNKLLSKLGLSEEKNLLSTFDTIEMHLANNSIEAYEHIRNLIEDMDIDANAMLPSLDAISKLEKTDLSLGAKERMRQILSSDESILDALVEIDGMNSKNGDLVALAKSYQKNPVEALSRSFYHGDQKNDFLQEARRELFKDAMFASNAQNDLGIFMHQIQHAGLSDTDLKKTEHLLALSYLQNTSYMSLKAPDILNESQIENTYDNLMALFMSEENHDMQKVFKRVSDENAVKRIAEVFEEDFLQKHVSVADRPSQYVHMSKGISVFDILEELNNGISAAGAKAIAFTGQYFAGRNNMQDVTTQSLYPYFGLFRLQNDVKRVGLNLNKEDTGDVLSIAKNIFTKRAMPIYALGIGASYLNYESENFFGQSFANMAAEATAKIDLGVRNIADSIGLDGFLKDAHYWFTPMNYYQEEEYQDAEERKQWYEEGYSPVKQSKFWSLGSSEFFGGKVLFYEPNYVKRSAVNWKDVGVYGSSEEKWKHSIIPTPRHPLSTIRYLTNPYWLEEKHKYDRPYMVSGPMFDPNTPWGTLGNLTIGNLIKPQKRMNQKYVTGRGVDVRNIIESENKRIMDEARSDGVISIKSSDTAIENAAQPVYTKDYSTGVMSVVKQENGGIGGYVARQEYKATNLDLVDKMQVFASTLQGSRDRVLNQIERMNYAIHEKAKWSYGNDTQFATDIINTKARNDNTLIQNREVASDLRNITSNQDMIQDLTYSIKQMSGIYNFIGESVLPSSKRYAYARSSDMYAKSNRFWDSGIDGADYGGFMEIARRFIPHEDRNRIRVNPLRNNMPSWMPEKFKLGDPYSMIKKGEMRLPGAGYEAMYGLKDPLDLSLGPSAVGKSKEEIIQTLIGSKIDKSAALLNSAEAGTALHEEYEQMLKDAGYAIETEGYLEDKKNNIKGFYDVRLRDETAPEGQAIMDIKTVSQNVFDQVAGEGAKREHLIQTNYYLGMTGLSKGYIHYINRDDPNQMLTFNLDFSQRIYEEALDNVKEARQEILNLVEKGRLSPYEFYSDMDRFKILADVAPGSAEYKKYRDLIKQTGSPEEKQEYEKILERVERQSQKHRFFNYKFTNVNIDKSGGVIESINQDGIKLVGDDTTFKLAGLKNYNDKLYDYLAPGMRVQLEYEKNYAESKFVQAAIYTGGLNINRQMMRDGVDRNDDGTAMSTRALLTKNQILLGKPFEMLSHMPIPFIHNKFLRVDSPYESWMRENIYGTKFSSWDNPIQTIIKPGLQQAWGSSITHGLIGAGLFALNEYVADIGLTSGQERAIRFANLAFTPGAFTGEVIERVATLNPNFMKKTSGLGAEIGSIIGLTGIALANSQNPFIAATSGAGIGATVGEWLKAGGSKNGALIGTAAGLAISAIKTKGFKASEMGSEYIPGSVKKRWEIEEYFDRLEYLKYKGLYEKASRLALDEEGVNIDKILTDMDKREHKADSKLKQLSIAKDNVMRSNLSEQAKNSLLSKLDAEIDLYANPNVDVSATPYVRLAIGYKQAMKSTVFGLEETASWAQMLRALEPYERDYFIEFAKETNPYKQKKILKSISPYKRKILENAWGSKKKTKQVGNHKYFMSHKLPNTFWSGWNAKTDLESYKVKTIMNEGMMLSDFGYYDSEKDKPEVRSATPIHYDQQSALLMRANLASVMNGLGITDSEISVLPSQQSGVQTALNIATVNTQKIKNALSIIGAQFY